MPADLPRVGHRNRIDWKSFLRIAAPVAAAVGLLTKYAPLLGWLVLLPGSVFLSVYVYRRQQPALLKTAQGVKMGLVIGLLNFAVFAAIFAMQVGHDPAGYRQQMESQMKDAFAHNPNPQAQQMAQTLFGGPGGVALLTAVGMAGLLVFLLIIGSVSGALASALGREKPPP